MTITITGAPDEVASFVITLLQSQHNPDDAARLHDIYDFITEGDKEIHVSDEPLQF